MGCAIMAKEKQADNALAKNKVHEQSQGLEAQDKKAAITTQQGKKSKSQWIPINSLGAGPLGIAHEEPVSKVVQPVHEKAWVVEPTSKVVVRERILHKVRILKF
ncbi:hypothetical protein ACH5RR_000963 [Cinchona calisaya]|uniref:Uncharacterized protein n=1 Tax=Cinchona calisaya TaxID=153742 RepID=A0ABD3B383_9GENT